MAIIFKPKPLILRLSLPEIRTKLVRTRLIDMVKLRLQTITQANGFLTDFGANVHRGMLIVAEPVVPCLNFWDTDESAIKAGSSMQEKTLSLIVASYDKIEEVDMADENNPDELCQPAVDILADVEIAVYRHHVSKLPDPTFEGLAKSLTLTDKNYVTGLQGAIWIQTVSTFVIVFNTRLGDPYQQTAP